MVFQPPAFICISFWTSLLFPPPLQTEHSAVTFWNVNEIIKNLRWHRTSLIIRPWVFPTTWETLCHPAWLLLWLHCPSLPSYLPLLKHSACGLALPQVHPQFASSSHSGLWSSCQSWEVFPAHSVSLRRPHLHHSPSLPWAFFFFLHGV